MWILKHFNENKWQEFALTLVSVWSSTEARYVRDNPTESRPQGLSLLLSDVY